MIISSSMDSFMIYLLSCLLLPLSICLIFFIQKTGSDGLKNLPPGSKGWPILGENIELAMSGFPKFVKHRMEKYSPDVFQTSLLGEKMAVFCGAEGNKFVLKNKNKLVTRWIPLSLKKVFFPDFDDGNEGPAALFRNFRHDVFKREAVKQYIPVMHALARHHVDHGWNPNSVVKVQPLSKKFTFALSSRLFLNLVDPGRVEKLSDPFAVMTNGVLSLPIDLPGTAFNRAIKASRIVQAEMVRVVEERRKEVMEKGEGQDLLSKMLLLTDENGRYVSDSKIANFFVALLLSSYDSTASAVTVVMNFLAELPHVYEEVLREQMEIAKSKRLDEMLTWEDIEKMKYSWNVVRESFRLAPPTLGTFREATTEFTYAGFTIPKGWKIFWTTNSSHKNPDYFPEPEKFDPSRFEGSGPAPYTFLPFGGGPTICPGRDYAKLAILVFIHTAVTRFRFEKAIANEKMVLHITPTLPHGLLLHLHPHQG